jgi:hypothetical protein
MVGGIGSYSVDFGLVRSLKSAMEEKGIAPVKLEDDAKAWRRMKSIHEDQTQVVSSNADVLARLSNEAAETTRTVDALAAQSDAIPANGDGAARARMTAKLNELQETQSEQVHNLESWSRIFGGLRAYHERMGAYFAQFNQDGSRKTVDASA